MSSTTSKVSNVCAAQRGKEHRMREVEMEEKLNKEAKKDVRLSDAHQWNRLSNRRELRVIPVW